MESRLGPDKRALNVANVPATVTTPTWGTNSYLRWAKEGHLGAHRREVSSPLWDSVPQASMQSLLGGEEIS